MKKLFPLFILLFCTATIFSSCKKEHGDETKNMTLNITIPAGTEYKLDLSQYGDTDDLARIVTQPANFTISQIDQITVPGVYTFLKNGVPKVGGNGNEVVILKVYEPAGRKHCDETNITINFTVL